MSPYPNSNPIVYRLCNKEIYSKNLERIFACLFFFFLKNYRFSVACNTKRMNCFPVLIGIVSNALLGIFNVTELIKTERSTFPPVSRGVTPVRGRSAGRKGQGCQSLYLSVQPAPCEPSCFLGLSSKSGMSSHLLYMKL